MIYIEEKPTQKVPGETSLFVQFNYNPDYVEIVKKYSGSVFHKKEKIWEVPSIYLAALLDDFCLHDSVDVKLLREKKAKAKDVTLMQHQVPPFDYQAEGIKYGLTHDKWLLLDMPGLGKSLQIIYIAEELKARGEIEHCLIICGVNSLKENWRKEIQKFTNLSCTILGERVTRTGSRVIGSIQERLAALNKPIEEFFVITNVETLREKDIITAFLKGPNKFDMIAMDEIHHVKDPGSRQGAGLLKLNKAKYQIGATGTVILNSPLDAYVPLKWIGLEKSTYTNFKYFYCTFGGPFHNIVCGFKNLEVLRTMLDEHSLRRSKDILNLPPKTIINEYVSMERRQADFYDNIKKGVKEAADKVELKTTSLLALASRLRQATACPSMLTTEDISSAKIERACDLVDQIISGGDKVVIFSTFKETVKVLAERLAKYNPLIGTGDVKDNVISANVDQFQTNPDNKVFICTWQRMGTGLTLTAASYVIFIDVPYTNADYEQAQDRCYRIGTSKNVIIYHLITTGTIDERVLDIVETKEAIGDYLEDGQISRQSLDKLKRYIEEL